MSAIPLSTGYRVGPVIKMIIRTNSLYIELIYL